MESKEKENKNSQEEIEKENQDDRMLEIPTSDSREDIKAREQVISDVYRKWYEANPSKAVYNNSLKENINVRFLSINETVHHASRSYLSALAVLQLDLILRTAYQVG